MPDPSNILIMRPGALGDIIVTLPLLAALRGRYGTSRIVLMASPGLNELIEGQGLVDDTISIDRSEVSALFMDEGDAPQRARDFFSAFDMAVSLWKDTDGRIRSSLERYVPAVAAIDPLPEEGSGMHAAQQILDRAVAANLLEHGAARELPRLSFRGGPADAAKELLSTAPPPRVAIHPGSGSAKKNWPADRFAQVAKMLRTNGRSIVLIEGPADADAAGAFTQASGDLPLVHLNCQPLRVVGAVLAECDLLVTNDSGVGHLAAAAGTPVLAIFGPSDPGHWRPLGADVSVIRAGDNRLDSVQPGAVADAGNRLLAEGHP